MENQQSTTVKMIQTKVSPEVAKRLESIEKRYGIKVYSLLRMLIDCLIRFMDDQHNLSEDLMRIIRMFENIPGWRDSICLANDGQDFGIVEAFYVIRAKGKDGHRLVHVERPMMDDDAENWRATYNVQMTLERFIEVLNPSLYKHLRMLAVDMGTESLYDTIQTIVNLQKENPDEAELRRIFGDNDWHEGGKVHDDTRYKQRNFHHMDYIDKQGDLFDDKK